MLLSSALLAGTTPAQTLPGTDQLPTGGVEVTTGPNGAQVGVDAGETGGANVGVGPGGVNLDLRGPQPPVGATPPSPGQPGQSGQTGGNTGGGQNGTAPRRDGAPRTSTPVGGEPRAARPGSSRRQDGGGSGARETSGDGRRASSGPGALESLRTAAARERERGDGGGGGVAPVFDLVERIPAAVRAGLVALALIAIALWALWVRGRRRLAGNAYQDPDTGVANLAAFEQVLDQEWQRAMRYRRPLGLVLLDLEEGAGERGLLGRRGANDAVAGISGEVRASDTVARLAPTRFAIICPEAPQGSIETVGRAIEHRLEEARLRCWAGVAERADEDASPGDLVTRAAAALASTERRDSWSLPEAAPEAETIVFPQADRPAAVA